VVVLVNVGVLALQGSVVEHMRKLSDIEGVNASEVRTQEQLGKVSGLILPGGESTTIGKLLKEYGLVEPLIELAGKGMPVWGTCAGMILMAREIVNENYVHLGIMDMAVRRNAYGGQLDSFSTTLSIPQVSEHDIPLVFIRAPWVEKVWGEAEVIAKVGKNTVAVRQGNMLATAFHPELTKDSAFHRYFSNLVMEWTG
jgi:5'-phosphate synthase pdxT subunit